MKELFSKIDIYGDIFYLSMLFLAFGMLEALRHKICIYRTLLLGFMLITQMMWFLIQYYNVTDQNIININNSMYDLAFLFTPIIMYFCFKED